MSTWIGLLFQRLNVDQRAMGFFIARKLWIHRNGKVWKNKLSTIGVVWDHVLQGLDEWHLAQASKLSIWQPTAEAFALVW